VDDPIIIQVGYQYLKINNKYDNNNNNNNNGFNYNRCITGSLTSGLSINYLKTYPTA
jgi:hypothetical protein